MLYPIELRAVASAKLFIKQIVRGVERPLRGPDPFPISGPFPRAGRQVAKPAPISDLAHPGGA